MILFPDDENAINNLTETLELSQSSSVEQVFPQHIAENSLQLVEFLKAYYDWMEQKGNVNNVIHVFGNQDKFVNYFADRTDLSENDFEAFARELYSLYCLEYSPSWPQEKIIREDLFIKLIRKIINTKGTVDSIKTFFKLIYNEEAEVTFPTNRRETFHAKTSSLVKTIIALGDPDLEIKFKLLNLLIGKYVYGMLGTISLVEKIEHIDLRGARIISVYLSNIQNGYYVDGDVVEYNVPETEKQYYTDPTKPEYICPLELFPDKITFTVGGIVTGYEIVESGSGYSINDIIYAESGFELQTARAYVTKVGANGEITELRISSNGYGYESRIIGRISSRNGSGAIISFSSSGITTWDKEKTFYAGQQYLVYYDNENKVSGNSDLFGSYYQSGYILEGYYSQVAGSRDPMEYQPMCLRSNDSKSFGKFYFEINIRNDSLTNQEFENQFISAGMVVGLAQENSPNTAVGSNDDSFGIRISDSKIFFNQQEIASYSAIPTIEGIKTIRFLVDFFEANLYIGNADGWYGNPTGELDSFPSTAVIKNFNTSEGYCIACSGRILPQISVEISTRIPRFKSQIPKLFGSSGSNNQNEQMFLEDYDPFVIDITPWDYSSSTYSITEEEFESVGEDVLYQYKIKTSSSSATWCNLFKACIHPAGTHFEAETNVSVTGSTGEAIFVGIPEANPNVEGDLTYYVDPMILWEMNTVTDLQENAQVLIGSAFDGRGISYTGQQINNISDLPIHFLDQNIIVNSVEVTLINTEPV